MGIGRSLCYSFHFICMRFAVEVAFFFPLNSTGRFTFMERLALTYVPFNEYIPFYRKRLFPSCNKKGKSVFSLNKCSIKTH